jgi:hypothetical protein
MVGWVTLIQKLTGRKWQLTRVQKEYDPALPSKNKKVVINVNRASL